MTLEAWAVGAVGAGAALIAAAVGPVEVDALVKGHAKIVPSKSAFVEQGSVAFDGQPAADPVTVVVPRVGRNREAADVHGAAGSAMIKCAGAIRVATKRLQ